MANRSTYIYIERETEREVGGDGHRLGLCLNRTNMDEQEHYVHLIETVGALGTFQSFV